MVGVAKQDAFVALPHLKLSYYAVLHGVLVCNYLLMRMLKDLPPVNEFMGKTFQAAMTNT